MDGSAGGLSNTEAMNHGTPHPESSDDVSANRSFARRLPGIVRNLLGMPLLVIGLNGFLNFIPPPTTPMPGEVATFVGALVRSGYMMPLIGMTHLIVGALLLANRWVPLALLLLAPFLVNSLAFHVFLEHSGLPRRA